MTGWPVGSSFLFLSSSVRIQAHTIMPSFLGGYWAVNSRFFSTFYLVCQLLSPYTGISMKHLIPFIYVLPDTHSLELPKQALTEGLLRSHWPWPCLQRITLLIRTGWSCTFPGQGGPSVCESWLSTGLKESPGIITLPLFLLQVLTSLNGGVWLLIVSWNKPYLPPHSQVAVGYCFIINKRQSRT